MPIPAQSVRNEATFAQLALSQPVAAAYFYFVMDPVIELVRCIAHDFVKRPHIYRRLDGAGRIPVARILGRLYAQYGSEPHALSKKQRFLIFSSLFGQSPVILDNGEHGFPRLALELINASSAFAERVYDTGADMLRSAVNSAHRPFRQYLSNLSGSSINWTRDEALTPITYASYSVLRDPGISAVFGLSAAPDPAWPFVEDANGDLLVEEVGRQIHMLASDEHTNDVLELSRERFSNLQRAALRGAEALATVLLYSESAGSSVTDRNASSDVLITACYTWGISLQSLR